MNNNGFTHLIAPTHQTKASVRVFKTKDYDLRPNRSIQSRIHLFVQEMPYLVHGTCLCMAVAVLLLVGAALVLAVQIGTKIVEGFELMLHDLFSATTLPHVAARCSSARRAQALALSSAPPANRPLPTPRPPPTPH